MYHLRHSLFRPLQVERIYAYHGLHVSEAFRQRMVAELACDKCEETENDDNQSPTDSSKLKPEMGANRTAAKAKPTVARLYSLDEYGISEADISSRYAAYIEKYQQFL